jgi:thiol-disulfide isomerase/thioredoxin
MKQLQHAALAAVALLCLNFKEVEAQKIVFQNLNYANAIAKAKKENKLVFLDVYTTWCGPCKMLEKNVFSEPKVGNYFNKNFICIHIDGDTEEGQKIAEKLNLEGYPTLYFIDGNDQVMNKSIGYIQVDELMETAKYALEPAEKPLNKLKKKFEGGDHSLATVYNYTQALMNEKLAYKNMVNDYIEKGANQIFLENDTMLYLFVISRHNLKQTGKLDFFIKNIDRFKEQYGNEVINEYVIKMAEMELSNWETSEHKTNVQNEIFAFCKAALDKATYAEIESKLKEIFNV